MATPALRTPDAPAVAEPVPLSLCVSRGTLGLELTRPVPLGPLAVTALACTLPGLSFPLDLSGGVRRFRHRRGRLSLLRLEVPLGDLEAWLATRLAGALGGLERAPVLWAVEGGLGVGLAGAERALAFELLWAPAGDTARWVLHQVRAAGIAGPALVAAAGAVDALFAGVGTRRGRVVTVAALAARVGREILPALGGRAPAVEGVRLSALALDGGVLSVDAADDVEPPALPPLVVAALSLAELAAEGDEALLGGDVGAARARYLEALERAPRHPELTAWVAEIDVGVAGRAEAALGLLAEAGSAVEAGLTGAELLHRTGDGPGALAAIDTLVAREAFAPLAALALARAADFADPLTAGALLDRAVARAPALAAPRWRRFEQRAARGDVRGALSDAEHLEAITPGALPRHRALVRAAQALERAGYPREAGRLFERALRHLPDDAAATAGLGRALLDAGRPRRALALLLRAVELSDPPAPEALLALARLLAGTARDLPQAVARVAAVPGDHPLAVEARAWEARWRDQLGDRVGASQAWGRLRELALLGRASGAAVVGWLGEAAAFEEQPLGDVESAERHRAAALRLAPDDAATLAAYRATAERVARLRHQEREAWRAAVTDPPPAEEPGPDRRVARDTEAPPPSASTASAHAPTKAIEAPQGPPVPSVRRPPDAAPEASRASAASTSDEEAEARVEVLTRRLHAEPEDEAVAAELLALLERLGRLREAFALVTGRLEDAEGDAVPPLRAARARLLAALEAEARAAGRDAEAALYAAERG